MSFGVNSEKPREPITLVGSHIINRRWFLKRLGAMGIIVSINPVLRWEDRQQPAQKEMLELLQLKAVENLRRYGNCAQASFVTLQEHFGLDDGKIFKALTPFPGIALRGETCGAVIGSIMALGMVFGREKQDDYSRFLDSLPPAREFCTSFEKKHGSTMCGDILESRLGRRFNLADPSGLDEYRKAGGGNVCSAVVSSAVLIAAEVISKNR